MIINPLKTTSKTAQIISLTVLLKLFSYELNIRKAQSQQKLIASFLSIHENHKTRIANINNLLVDPQQDIPTKVWIRDENEFIRMLQKTQAIKFRRCKCQNVEYDYSVKTRILSKSLKNNFEEEIIDTFVQRINRPTPLHIELINSASKLDGERTITIVSSFPISRQKSKYLITAIREKIADRAKIRFQISKFITNRIELRDRGYKIHWNLEHYVTELDRDTSNILA